MDKKKVYYHIKFIIVTYILFSFTEWLLHSKIMHGNPDSFKKIPFIGKLLAKTANGHLKHHIDVNMDMSLHSKELSESLFFGWDTAFQVIAILLIIGVVNKKILKLSNKTYLIYILSISLIYCILWNNIHVDMHGIKGQISVKNGIPNKPGLLSRGPIYRYLWKYHAIHHLQKGERKGNFNIILPGADYIFGTHNGFCYDNNEYCKNNKDKRCTLAKKRCLTNSDILKT